MLLNAIANIVNNISDQIEQTIDKIYEYADRIGSFITHNPNEFVIALSAAATALFTYILATRTSGLFKETAGLREETAVLAKFAEQQASDMKASIGAAQKAANATEQSAQALMATERAWLLLEIESNNFRDALDRAEVFVVGKNGIPIDVAPTVRYRFRNYGKTPAFVKELCHELKQLTALPQELQYFPDIAFDTYIVGAGEATRSQSDDAREPLSRALGVPFYREAADSIRMGESRLWFYGRVVYDDVWGNERVSRFCWVYDAFINTFGPYNGKPYNESA